MKIGIAIVLTLFLTSCGIADNSDQNNQIQVEVEVSVQEIEDMINAGNLSEAREILANLLGRKSQNQDLYLLLAKCELLMGNIQKSLVAVQGASEMFGDSLKPGFFRIRGMAYSRSGNNQEAKRNYDEFLSIDNTSASAFNERGTINMSMGNFLAACSDFSQSLKLNQSAIVLNNLGHSLYTIGEYDSALACYNKSIWIDSTISFTYYNRGGLLVEATMLNEGLRDLKKAEKLGFNDEGTLFMNLGQTYFYLEQFENACKYWEKAKNKGNVQSTQLLTEHCKSTR